MKVEKELDRGVLIAIEGIDGAGKTAQAKILYRNLEDRGYKVVLLHEPTDGLFGKKIKESMINGLKDPYEELEYFIKDRKEDVNKNIKPALDNQMIVIMDRYYFSTIAYQGAAGIDRNKIREMNEKFSPKPDLTIILDVAPTIGLSRIREERNSKPNRFERKSYLTKVREIFKNIKDPSIQVIDGALSVDKISSKILNMALNAIKSNERTRAEERI